MENIFETTIVNGDEIEITRCRAKEVEELNIPSTIDGYIVSSIGIGAFVGCYHLKSVTLPNSITNIGEVAFKYCDALTRVNIPSDSKLISIEGQAFYYCDLTSITIPSSVRSLGYGALSGCSSIKVEEGNPMYAVKDGVLFNQSFEELIQYPSKKKDSVYVIPSSVTKIRGSWDSEISAFSECEFLTNIKIPKDSRLEYIGECAFRGCKSLIHITLPDNITSIEYYAFAECKNLTDITIPSGVTYIGEHAFFHCNSLKKISIPASVTDIESYAFFDCHNLETVKFLGDAPCLGKSVFDFQYTGTGYCSPINATIEYFEDATGFSEEAWEDYTTEAVPREDV